MNWKQKGPTTGGAKIGYCVEIVYIWCSSQTTLDMVLRVEVGVESKSTNFRQQDQGFPTAGSREKIEKKEEQQRIKCFSAELH